jgi:Tol biopolymer transport system component
VFDLAARTVQVLHPYESQGVGWPPAPVWSPDGAWLAFGDGSPSDQAGLWVARVEGDEQTQEHHLGLGGNPVWSPDGRWLAFQAMGHNAPPTYDVVEISTWKRRTLDIPVDRYGQLLDWTFLD